MKIIKVIAFRNLPQVKPIYRKNNLGKNEVRVKMRSNKCIKPTNGHRERHSPEKQSIRERKHKN